jgi:hypothetical protein
MATQVVSPGLVPTDILKASNALMPSTYKEITIPDPVDQLRLGQYQLGNDFTFGTRSRYAVPNDFLVNSFELENGSIDDVDDSMPGEDGTIFGIDYREGQTISFKLYLWRKGQPALDDLAKIRNAWRGDSVRKRPGAVTTLRMNKQNRTRLVYGRPRRFSPTFGAIERGWAPIDCDFKCVDEAFYDDVQNYHTMGMGAPPTAGLVAPFTIPLVVFQYETAAGSFRINGDMETWPTFTIKGPCVNPTVEILNHFKFSMNVALYHTDVLTIDPRPWRRTTLLNGELNRSGRFTAESVSLPDMKLPPGQHSMRYKAFDESLASTVTIGWRNAYSTP